MVDTILGILLVLAVGVCVLAFPFVLWMLLGNGPRSQRARYIARSRRSGKIDTLSIKNHKKTPPGYDGAGE
jgi:hypothetical protein